jgi:hypothetical protein
VDGFLDFTLLPGSRPGFDLGQAPRFDPRAAAEACGVRDYHGAMRIAVECYAGYRGEQEPRAFTLGARRFEVCELVDRWLHPAHRYYKVRVDDGRLFILRHDAGSGEWDLAGLVGRGWHGGGGGVTLH